METKELTALERIEELRKEHLKFQHNRAYLGLGSEYTELLFKAFHVMREIAIEKYNSEHGGDNTSWVDEKFETQMKDVK